MPTVLNPRMVCSMCITLWQNKCHMGPENLANFSVLFMHTKVVATFPVTTALLSKGRELKLTEYWIKTLASKILASLPIRLALIFPEQH